ATSRQVQPSATSRPESERLPEPRELIRHMCGFIGRVGSPSRPTRVAPDLRAGLRFLSRRGPDSARLWESADHHASLLHARLAIVDGDERAHQPFVEHASGVTIAFNGEIYNYRELRDELRSYDFRTDSDTE